MALSINDIKSGVTILADDAIWAVVETQHVKPGKGAAFVRAKLRNLRNGSIQEKTFRGDEKIDEAFIEEKKLQYQYASGKVYHFMDQDNYEEVSLHEDILGDKKKFLRDNLEVTGFFYKNESLNVSLPNIIEFKVVHTEPGIKGDTAKGGSKLAQIETGAKVNVPLFIKVGDNIKVDTRTGEYVERAY